MKVYMSVDLEGISGVVGSYQVLQNPGALPEIRELLTADVNAAIAGAKAGGATTIWVNENHSGRDLILDEVDPIAEVLIGKPKPLQTLEGIDDTFDCVFMIGMHAAAGTKDAVLAHSWSVKCIQTLRVNGKVIGELGLKRQKICWAWLNVRSSNKERIDIPHAAFTRLSLTRSLKMLRKKQSVKLSDSSLLRWTSR
jgi:D-amino peptidase